MQPRNGGRPGRSIGGKAVDEDVVGVERPFRSGNAEACAGVALRVEVEDEDGLLWK